MSKRYRLLKDLPYAKAGSVYKQSDREGYWYNDESDSAYSRVWANVVMETPEWFELIPDTPTTSKRYRLRQTLLMSGMIPIILPIGYEVKLRGDRYIGEGGWFFHPHGVEDNKFHWEEVVEQTTKEGLWSDKDVCNLEDEICKTYDVWIVEKRQTFRQAVNETLRKLKASKQSQSNTPKYQYVDSNMNLHESDTPVSATVKINTPKEEQPSKDWQRVKELGQGLKFSDKSIVGVQFFDSTGLKSKLFLFDEKLPSTKPEEQPKMVTIIFNPSDSIEKSTDIMKSILLREGAKYESPQPQPTEQPTKERIEDIVRLLRDCVSRTWGNPSLDRTQELFDDFLVERNLVNRSVKQMNKLITGMVNEILLDKKYTQEQLDKAIEDTWYAAREKFIIDRNPADKQYRFLSLQQYLSTIKNNKTQ